MEYVVLGRLHGLFGTRGWLKVFSYTRPREQIFAYSNWLVSRRNSEQTIELEHFKPQGNGLIVKLAGIDDRTAATEYVGAEIRVARADLPVADSGEYYWTDLVGLEVSNLDDVRLGRVVSLLETAAHDILVVRSEQGKKQERLIPFVTDVYIMKVDLDAGRLLVDWHPDD